MFILVVLLVLAGIFFLPRSYDVPQYMERQGTRYWKLSTGSVIGYTRIAGAIEHEEVPIVYLHGGPGGVITDEIIDAFRPLATNGHDIYLYDQVGSGHSNRLEDITEYSVERHRKDLAEIIDSIGARQVILVAHSWGCLLAVNFLQHYPEKVSKLLLEGPGPMLPVNENLKNLAPPDSLALQNPVFSNRQGNRDAYNFRSTLMRLWALRSGRKLAGDREADEFFTYLNGYLNRSVSCHAEVEEMKLVPGGGYYAHIMTVQSFDKVEDRRDLMHELQLPVLLLRGQCDNQEWGYTKEYLDLLPNSRLVIVPNSGHDLIGGNREAWFQDVSGFLQIDGGN